MLELAMTPSLRHLKPAIILDQFENRGNILKHNVGKLAIEADAVK